MAESKISYNDMYTGVYPTVFKKINSSDITSTPFKSYKSWTVISGSSTSSCLPLNGIFSDVLPLLGSELTYNDAKNIDDSLQTIIYNSINHIFYKYKKQPFHTLGTTNLNNSPKFLYQSASILSFPYKKIGEGIRPASFTFTGSQFQTGLGGEPLLQIYSDKHGNLLSTTFPTNSIVGGVRFYEGFNEYFDTSRIPYESENVTYVSGVTSITNPGPMIPIGLAAEFSGLGYIKTTLNGEYSRDTNYAICFFASGSDFCNTFSGSKLLIAKASGSISQQYPFKIEVSGSQELVFSVSGGSVSVQVSQSISETDWMHVTCQKTGSMLQMYIDGALVQSASADFLTNTYDPTVESARIDNIDPLWIGGFKNSIQSVSGSIDEVRIFNKALTSAEIYNLQERRDYSGYELSLLQTNHVGNIFPKQGIAVISTLDYRFHDILQQSYTSSYKSTLTSYELGVVVKLDSGDFNLSLNQSLTMDNDITYHSFVSGSDFTPYITTIGLYDDAGQLLAIGKLAQPIKKPAGIDLNFLVRIDLDNNIIVG